MRKKRIDGALASIPVQNGQVLKGEHLAILREVLSTAINENKYDIDRIISADSNAIHVYGESAEDLDNYIDVPENTYAYVHTAEGIDLYKFNLEWIYVSPVSLIYILEKIQEILTIIT